MTASDLKNDEKKARLLFDKQKYNEASKLYKRLLAHEKREEWIRGLAQCYLKRAMRLAEQKKYKDALMLWENYSQLVEPPYPGFEHYVVWQLLAGSKKGIAHTLSRLSRQQLDQDSPRLARLLGFLILFKEPGYQQSLPQDSNFIAHLNIAQSALQAFKEDRLNDMQACLAKIPYRSAFRDFCTLLKAVISTAEACNKPLDRIPVDSPYGALARLLRICRLAGSALAYELVQLTHQQRRVIYAIKGISKTQQQLIDLLAKNKDRLNNKIKFNLVIRFKNLGDVAYAQRFCQAMLLHYPAGRKDFARHFQALTPFEENRLKAIRYEQNDDLYAADHHWQQCIEYLKQEAGNELKIALILRHIAENHESSARIMLLDESLHYDPGDKETHLKLLDCVARHEPYELHAYLDNALKQRPDDIDILAVAMQQAAYRHDFAAAREHAQKILDLEPVHSEARLLVFESALMIIRQLLKEKAWAVAEKEIQSLEKQKLTVQQQHAVQILQGFLFSSVKNKQQGLQCVVTALEALCSDTLSCHFQAAMEALLCGKPVATLLRALPPIDHQLLTAHSLDQLHDAIKTACRHCDIDLIHKALAKIKAPLKKLLAHAGLDEKQLLRFCALLAEIRHFELLRHCVATQFSDDLTPIWIYYRIYSKVNGQPDKLTFMQKMGLEHAMDEARQSNDHQTAVLIGQFLSQSSRFSSAFEREVLGGLANEEEMDPMEKVFANIPDEIMDKISHQILKMVSASPETLVREFLEKADDKVLFMRVASENPDFLVVLLTIKAADQLNIDLGFTVQDVLNIFSHQ